MQRILSGSGLIIAALLISGCGAVDFAYNNAPGFVASKADDAFDLDDAQSDAVEQRLEVFFDWHRQQELPRYRDLLDSAAISIADGITANEFLELSDELRLAWNRAVERAIDDLGDFALELTPQQIDHFEQYFEANSSKFDNYLEKSEQQREIYRVERGIDRLEGWFGDFDYEQRKKVSARLQQLPEFYIEWIEYREARQQALLKALRAASSSGLSRQQLYSILLDPSTDYAQPFEQSRRAYAKLYAEAIEDISKDLSKDQLRHAVERLKTFSEIADRLARAS